LFNVFLGSGWRVERVGGTAAAVHGAALPGRFERTVRFVDATGDALVLGSTQPWVEARGIDVVRRRSGGGAVLVRPGELVWADVLVPAGDPRRDEDVARSFHWLGAAWAAAVGGGAVWHDGPLVRTRLSGQVCFAGLGPGEVSVGGRKVVGLAQRRTRAGSLFQCAALLRWEPRAIVELLGLDREALGELEGAAAALDVTAADLEAAFLAAIDGATSDSD
jgi:lipoate---protein ligase